MQPEDDLYTGMSMNPMQPETETNEEALKAERKRLQEMLPTAQMLQELIQEERESVKDIRTYISTLTFADRLKSRLRGKSIIEDEFRAREIYLGLLDMLESRITTDMAHFEEEQRKKRERAGGREY